jgi:hypothetical protein
VSEQPKGSDHVTRFKIHRLQTLAPAAGSSLLWVCAIALWAWFAAGWYWRLSAPPAASAPNQVATDPTVAARDVATRHLFGEVVVQMQAVVASRFSLLGVAAHSRKSPGWAIISEDGKPAQGFVQGDEITSGVKLVAVLPDGVEIERNGSRERIPLNVASAQAGGSAAPNAPAQPSQFQGNTPGGPPGGFTPSRYAPGMSGESAQPAPNGAPENQATQ